MAVIKKDYQVMQKLGEDDFLLLHPETNAGNVIVDVEGITAKDAAAALSEIKKIADSKAETSDIPDVSRFITKSINDLINYYTKSAIDDKITDLEGKISAIPKFSVSVVSARPTENINETTIYLVKTGDDNENLYTEYIYVNGSWEMLGTQVLKLTGYATETWVTTQIANYVTESRVNELIAAAAIKTAETADKLSTARKVSLNGDIIGETFFDGSDDVTISATLSKTGVVSGVYSAVQVDESGRVTGGSQAIEIATDNQATPSQNLAVGGLFFKLL